MKVEALTTSAIRSEKSLGVLWPTKMYMEATKLRPAKKQVIRISRAFSRAAWAPCDPILLQCFNARVVKVVKSDA